MSRGNAPSKVLPSQFNPPKTESGLNTSRRWWEKSGTDCAKSMRENSDTMQQAQTPRIRQQVINQSLYGNRRLSAVQAQARARLVAAQSASRNTFMSDNQVQAIIDTGTSKIGENKPRPYFLTSGGNYKQQRKAKKLNKYIDGVFFDQKAYDLMPQQFRDACIDGDGLIFADVVGGKVRYEVVTCMELWCDDEESQYGRPINLLRDKQVDRDRLAAAHPKLKDEIMRATSATPSLRQQTTSDMVRVIEGWHLGNMGKDGELSGGIHAMALVDGAGLMLVEPEEWKHDFFPFSKMPWCAPPTAGGFWGQALAEQLAGDQIELNKELRLVQQSMHMAGVLKYFFKIGSGVVQDQMNNEIGTGFGYAGDTPPQFFCPEPINEVFFTNPDRIRARMKERAGQNEMAMTGQKPKGVESGEALRALEDQQSDRHKTSQRQYQTAAIQLAEITIALSVEAAANGDLEAVRVPGKQSFDTIDFKDDLKGLERSQYTLQCYPTDKLPQEPGARLATITEHIQAGMISIRLGKKLLAFPDLETEVTLETAMEILIGKVLDAIVDDGKYQPPEPNWDLSLCKEMVLEYLAHFEALDLEEERMDDLRAWSLQVDEMMADAMQPAPMAMGAPGPGMGPPQAAPQPTPQSPLVPNAAPQMAKAA